MIDIDTRLAERLVGEQFPDWADLPIRPVETDGVDNRTFRLGDAMLVRLPSAEDYAAQVDKEQHWLPKLAPFLSYPVPLPLGLGRPGCGYPWPWSVYRWLDGESALAEPSVDLERLAVDLARFLTGLQAIDTTGGPPAGEHNFHRGGSLGVYNAEIRSAISALSDELDAAAIADVWDAALAADWRGHPVWVHGDVAAGNLLVKDSRLCAVIDFGCLGVGDPACDLVVAWTLFDHDSRERFRTALGLDAATWRRAQGWALWKALITLVQHQKGDAAQVAEQHRVLKQVLDDHAVAASTT